MRDSNVDQSNISNVRNRKIESSFQRNFSNYRQASPKNNNYRSSFNEGNELDTILLKDPYVANSFRKSTDESSSFDRNFITIKRKRVLMLGAPGVGKSAVVLRFKDDIFRSDYIPTLQESCKKEFMFNNERIELEIFDLEGQNEFTLFTMNKFAHNINGYILSFSVENMYSFKMIETINFKLNALVGDKIPKVLVANKSDLENKRIISYDQGKALAKEINAIYIECSARNGDNIQNLFYNILVEINKSESNIDIKNFACNWLIKHVLKNFVLHCILNYILLIIQIVRNILLVYKFVINSFSSILCPIRCR